MQSKLAAAIVFFGGRQRICALVGMSAGTLTSSGPGEWLRPGLGVSTRVVWGLKHPQFGSTAIGLTPGT